MAAGGTTKVVVAALAANGLIAVSKFVAAGITGSAAMLSEALHSVADTSNQGLLIGEAASPEVVAGVRKLIEAEATASGAIRRVHAIRTMHLGPQDVLLTARFDDSVSAAQVEGIVGDLERAIKARYPEVRQLFLAAQGD